MHSKNTCLGMHRAGVLPCLLDYQGGVRLPTDVPASMHPTNCTGTFSHKLDDGPGVRQMEDECAPNLPHDGTGRHKLLPDPNPGVRVCKIQVLWAIPKKSLWCRLLRRTPHETGPA